MNKKLLIAILLGMALTGCGGFNEHDQVAIFPGTEDEMVAMCTPNGGFVFGYVQGDDILYYKSISVQTYRTTFHVECKNGAKIDKTFERHNP